MSETKQFELRTLLSVTTGRLLTKPKGDKDNGIGDLYAILGWMTNDSPMTHQLPRFGDECKPWLLRWFPELEALTPDVIAFCDALADADTDRIDLLKKINRFVFDLGERIGRHEFAVPRIPQDDHEVKDPIAELIQMRGTDEGIVSIVAE